MNDLDKWTAEQCGVRFQNEGASHWYIPPSTLYPYEWTLNDARCREIVREHFKIGTSMRGKKWIAIQNAWTKVAISNTDQGYIALHATGKTIAEAEIACIKAIKEASDG